MELIRADIQSPAPLSSRALPETQLTDITWRKREINLPFTLSMRSDPQPLCLSSRALQYILSMDIPWRKHEINLPFTLSMRSAKSPVGGIPNPLN